MAAFVITRTDSIVKPGLSKFVPFKTDHVSYDSRALAESVFEGSYKSNRDQYDIVERDGMSFEVQISPYSKSFIELTVVE